MFCKICGSDLAENEKICKTCGANIESQIASVNPPYENTMNAVPVPPVEQADSKKGIAIASLVLGIVSISISILCGCCIPFVGAAISFVCAIVGIILGIGALKSSKKTFAIVGISLSSAAIIFAIVCGIFWAVMINSDNFKSDFWTSFSDEFENSYSQQQ